MEESTTSLSFCEVKVSEYSELERIATEKDAEGVLVNGQWYLKELEGIIPPSRNIVVMREFDYYVYQAPSTGEEYRFERAMLDSIGAVTTKPDYWDLTGVTGAPVTEPATPPPPPQPPKKYFEEAPKVFKKKPKAKNVHPIEVGDLCLVNGLAIPQTVTSIVNDGDGYKVVVSGATTHLKSEDVFPLYKLNKSAVTEYQIGDVISTHSEGFALLKDADLIAAAKSQGFVDIYRITDPNDKLIPRVNLKLYSGGEYTLENGNRVTADKLESILNNRFKPIVTEVGGSFEIELIAKHYNIKPEDVKPKEVKILKCLEVLLDHPECVKQKEWAMIIGPSGSGKTTVAIEYAESKGSEYVIMSMNAQVTVDDLLGYNSITTGEYFPSLLRDAVETGKVFILDEIDASNPNTLLCLNAFKLDKIQFPDKLVDVHPNFRMIATANTLVRSEDYNGRSAMDRASIKRFSSLFYDLSEAEVAIRYGFENVKHLTGKLTDKKAYSTADYELVHGCILQPKNDFDPRDIQRMVMMNKLAKEGAFK